MMQTQIVFHLKVQIFLILYKNHSYSVCDRNEYTYQRTMSKGYKLAYNIL